MHKKQGMLFGMFGGDVPAQAQFQASALSASDAAQSVANGDTFIDNAIADDTVANDAP